MKFSVVLCFWYLLFEVFLYLPMFLHSSFHHGAAFGFGWKVCVCGMCFVAASSMMSVNWLMALSGCMCSSMWVVQLFLSALLKFHLGKDGKCAMFCPVVIWIERWSLTSEVVQEQDVAWFDGWWCLVWCCGVLSVWKSAAVECYQVRVACEFVIRFHFLVRGFWILVPEWVWWALMFPQSMIGVWMVVRTDSSAKIKDRMFCAGDL